MGQQTHSRQAIYESRHKGDVDRQRPQNFWRLELSGFGAGRIASRATRTPRFFLHAAVAMLSNAMPPPYLLGGVGLASGVDAGTNETTCAKSFPNTTTASTDPSDRTAVDDGRATVPHCIRLPPSQQEPLAIANAHDIVPATKVERRLIKHMCSYEGVLSESELSTVFDNTPDDDKLPALLQLASHFYWDVCKNMQTQSTVPPNKVEQQLLEYLSDGSLGDKLNDFQWALVFDNTPDCTKLHNLLSVAIQHGHSHWIDIICQAQLWDPVCFHGLLRLGKEDAARRLVANAPSSFVHHSTDVLSHACFGNCARIVKECVDEGVWHAGTYYLCLEQGNEALADTLAQSAPTGFMRYDSSNVLMAAIKGRCFEKALECVRTYAAWHDDSFTLLKRVSNQDNKTKSMAFFPLYNALENTYLEKKRSNKCNDFTKAYAQATKVYPDYNKFTRPMATVEVNISGCNIVIVGISTFSSLSNLKRLNLSACKRLVKIVDKALSRFELTSLNLTDCSALKSIGFGAFFNSCIDTLDLKGCSNLLTIGENAFYSAPLTTLSLSDCATLATIGARAFFHSKLQTLDLSGCVKLQIIYSYAFFHSPLLQVDFSNCVSLAMIAQFAFKSHTKCNSSIDLSACKSITGISNVGVHAFGANAYKIRSGKTFSLLADEVSGPSVALLDLSEDLLRKIVTPSLIVVLINKPIMQIFHSKDRALKTYTGDIIVSKSLLQWAVSCGFQWNESTCKRLAESGNLECLRYAHNNGCPWSFITCWTAAENGHLHCLKYARENGCPFDEHTCLCAAENGHLNCLQYAYENIREWDEDTCQFTARNGHLNCLRYAHENGCPWDEFTCYAAADYGHLNCLQYAHENGCPWDEHACLCAAENGHLNCLKYAHQNDCPWDEYTCTRAAENGHLNCLQYAHENGCPWDEFTCQSAAKNGHLHCLKYAHDNGCPWTTGTCTLSASGGHLHCLQYAHDNGCPWDEVTCELAARKGHLHCLHYAFQNGCRWGKYTCLSAAHSGHLDCLKYAHENGCPWHEQTSSGAACEGHKECFDYARKFGCPLFIHPIKSARPCPIRLQEWLVE